MRFQIASTLIFPGHRGANRPLADFRADPLTVAGLGTLLPSKSLLQFLPPAFRWPKAACISPSLTHFQTSVESGGRRDVRSIWPSYSVMHSSAGNRRELTLTRRKVRTGSQRLSSDLHTHSATLVTHSHTCAH